MPSMVLPTNLKTPLQPLEFLQSPKLFLKPVKTSFSTNSNPRFSAVHYNANSKCIPRNLKPATVSFTDDDDIMEEDPDDEIDPDDSEKLGVFAKSIEKPRLMLKFIWMEKNIGISLDQMIPGYGSIPLSPYYFWPRKDAWEELKELLESKPWISQKQMIVLLNQATDIINLGQQGGGSLA